MRVAPAGPSSPAAVTGEGEERVRGQPECRTQILCYNTQPCTAMSFPELFIEPCHHHHIVQGETEAESGSRTSTKSSRESVDLGHHSG